MRYAGPATSRTAEEKGIGFYYSIRAKRIPGPSVAENLFLGNERSLGGIIDWDRTNEEAKKAGYGGLCEVAPPRLVKDVTGAPSS